MNQNQTTDPEQERQEVLGALFWRNDGEKVESDGHWAKISMLAFGDIVVVEGRGALYVRAVLISPGEPPSEMEMRDVKDLLEGRRWWRTGHNIEPSPVSAAYVRRVVGLSRYSSGRDVGIVRGSTVTFELRKD